MPAGSEYLAELHFVKGQKIEYGIPLQCQVEFKKLEFNYPSYIRVTVFYLL